MCRFLRLVRPLPPMIATIVINVALLAPLVRLDA
jgi:hypothetical protein